MHDDATTIEIAGKKRRIRFSFTAFRLFERETGKNILKLDWENLSATDFVALLWAGLAAEDKEITLDEVSDAVDLSNIEELQEALYQAFQVTMPGKGDGADPLLRKSRRSTGSRSGP